MPPRLSKRQQREQDELEALAGASGIKETSDRDSDESIARLGPATQGAAVGFAALRPEDEEEEVSEHDEAVKTSKHKKRKKKKEAVRSASPQAGPSKKRTKNDQDESKLKSRSKPKSKSKPKVVEEEEDFDKVLAELSGKYSDVRIGNPQTDKLSSLSSYDVFHHLLSVSMKNLDPETELRRFFGSKVITSSSSSGGPASRLSRSGLVRPQPTWPPAQYRAGLSLHAFTSDELDVKFPHGVLDTKERWWTFETSPRYKGTTYEYLQCVMGGDPQLFYSILHEMPWHADTLLQMAEVYRHREEYSTAADFMSRAIFAYERGFTGAFNFTSGIHRLDFDHVENRVFFLALARTVVDLNRRGTPRTAFEFARLLYSLEPHTDPHGALLHLDSLAIKAKQIDWFLELWDAFQETAIGRDGGARFDVTFLPGWHWSRALALFEREGDADEAHIQSTKALMDAIVTFPSIAPLLADKLDINIPSEVRKLDAFRVVTGYSPHKDELFSSLIHLLSHIYVSRSFSLWKSPARCSWLSKCLTSLHPSDVSSSDPPPALKRFKTMFDLPSILVDAIYRHVITTSPLTPEFLRLTAFFPGYIKLRVENGIEGDPLPPGTTKTSYNDQYFLNVRSSSSAPTTNLAGQAELQAMLEANPGLAARFPGGLAEMAEMARLFPQELLDAMMGILGDDANAHVPEEHHVNPEGRMPGGHEQVLDDNAEQVRDEHASADMPVPNQDSESEEEEEAPREFLPLRIFRTLLGRVWGSAHDGADESDSDEHEPVRGDELNNVD